MIKTIEKRICDVCKKEVEDFAGSLRMVTHINSIDDEEAHIYAGARWINDKELGDNWRKVDR